MILRLLSWAARQAVEHPRRVAVWAIAPCLVLISLVAIVPIDLTFTGLMDRSNERVERYFQTMEHLGLGGNLPLLVKGPEEKLDEAIRALAPALLAHPEVRRVDTELPVDWLEANAPFLVDQEAFDLWLGLATRPDDAEGAKRLATKLEAVRAQVEKLRPEGRRIVQVTLERDPLDFEAGGRWFYELDEVKDDLLSPYGVTGSFAGIAAVGAQDQKRTLGRMTVLTPISLLFVLLLLRVVESSVRRLLAAALPMLLSIGASLGAVGMLLGKITIMESFFGVMVIGLGIDFALHLMVRLRDERARGVPYPEAVEITLRGTGRGIIAGALTTTGAFTIVALAPDPSTRHMGAAGAIGLLLCLALMLTLLPALWSMLERTGRDRALTTSLELGVVTRLARHAARHPKLHVSVGLAVAIVAGLGASRFHFETDLAKVFNRDVPALAAIEEIQEIFSLNARPWITYAEPEEAKRLTEAFKAAPGVVAVESVSALLPDEPAERRERLTSSRSEIDAQIATYRALIPLVTDEEAKQLRGALQLLEALEKAADGPSPTADTLPTSLKSKLVGPDGVHVVYVYSSLTSLDGTSAGEERSRFESIDPKVTGFGGLLEQTMAAERPWAIPIFLGILLFVAVVLIVDLRDWRMVLLALTPVLLGTTITFGVLCWAEMSFNLLTVLVVPLIIGLGVDDGIHVVHRFKEDRNLPPAAGAAQVGKAIVMTTLTTCVSFAVLLLTDHAGMESMALVMVIGLPVCLFASITTIPALATLLRVNAPAARPSES